MSRAEEFSEALILTGNDSGHEEDEEGLGELMVH